MGVAADRGGYIQELKPNHTVTRDMKGGETHTYQLLANKGLFVHVDVEQRGIDVTLTLLGPKGEKIFESDSTNGAWGPDAISWVAEQTGEYQVEVRPFEKIALPAT